MSIARLKKVTICGLLTEKADLLKGLQALGCMHLLPLRPAPAEAENVASPRADAAYKALRFLSDMPERRKQVTRDPNFDVDKVVDQALAVKDRLRDVTDRRDFLEYRIQQVEPWGDILFPPGAELAGYRLWFYILPVGKTDALHEVELPWQVVRKDHRFAYVVVIAKEEPAEDLLPVPRTHTGALPLNELKAELEQTEVDIEDTIAERHALTRYIYLLSLNLAEAENRAGLAHADQQTRDEDGIVAVQGWVPEDALAGVEAFAEEKGLACLTEEVRPDEEPPTLIEQPPDMKAGAVLSVSYTVPTYRMWDPSVVLFFSFAVFFAMILADAGYAAVLMAGLLISWKRLGKSENGRASRIMLVALFGFSIIYGIMSGGYFGVTPPEGSALAVFHVINLNDYGAAMKLAIVIGVLHLVLANAIVAFINRHRTTSFANLGWIAGLIGGVTVTYSEPGGFFSVLGIILLVGGVVAIFLFTSERPIVNRPMDYLWRALDGFKALTGVMGAFGDVLSYLRLFALGLATASLGATFNNLAVQANDGIPGLGLLFAILILILGHTVTLSLGIMSGVVHGLRLNFIEFYKWGMPGEGSVFRKFARKEVQP
ncbi:MAG: V-type ATP synthase subunit I [Alphaproteobacteria bacterium]|nr:V-type ATP synthase subunit I [Alphaproteobacteria bacterium]